MGTGFFVTYLPSSAALRIVGELDISVGDELDALLGRVAARRPHRTEVHLGEVSFIDASTLGRLFRHQQCRRAHGGDLAVVAASPRVTMICHLAQYVTLLPDWHGDVDAAPLPRGRGERISDD